MYYRHKGHGFSVTTEQLPHSERWTFVAKIHKDDEQEITNIDSKKTFATAREAQTEGLRTARKWIDDAKLESK